MELEINYDVKLEKKWNKNEFITFIKKSRTPLLSSSPPFSSPLLPSPLPSSFLSYLVTLFPYFLYFFSKICIVFLLLKIFNKYYNLKKFWWWCFGWTPMLDSYTSDMEVAIIRGQDQIPRCKEEHMWPNLSLLLKQLRDLWL